MKKILAFALILSLIFLSGCKKTISTSVSPNNVPESLLTDTGSSSELVNNLYKCKNTSISNQKDIIALLESLPYFPEKNISTSASNGKLDITYNVGLRSKYRNNKENLRSLKQIFITVFPLINDASQINITIKDVYGDFYSLSMTREEFYKISETTDLTGLEYFTEENINNSLKSKEALETYVVKVLDINYLKDGYELQFEQIYKKLTDEEVFVEGTVQIINDVYIESSRPFGLNLKAYADKNKIDMSNYYNKTLLVVTADVYNFVKDITVKKVFVLQLNQVIISENI